MSSMFLKVMSLPTLLLCVAKLLVQAAAATYPASNQQPLSLSTGITFRDAVFSDIDDIVTVSLDAFSQGESFKYRIPGYEQFKDYTWYCGREQIKRTWKAGVWKDFFVKVVTVPRIDHFSSSAHNDKVVAFGVWEPRHEYNVGNGGSLTKAIWSALHHQNSAGFKSISPNDPPYDCSLRLGTNVTRAEDLDQQLDQVADDYIHTQFPDHLYLAALATHPTWDGHNFAAMNLQWGMELAKTRKLPITLVATPAGYPLYHSLGFRSIKNATLTKLDGEGDLWVEVMAYESS